MTTSDSRSASAFDLGIELARVALGKDIADTVVKNARLLDVFTAVFTKADIAIKKGRIAAVGQADSSIGESTVVVEADDCHVVPGLLDGHMHVEDTFLTFREYAKIVVPRGTTTVIADFHPIASVLGPRGIRLMLDEAKTTPLKVFGIVPSAIPASLGFENPGHPFTIEDIRDVLSWNDIVGIGEVGNLPGIFAEDPYYLANIRSSFEKGKRIEGSFPIASEAELNALAALGVVSDHECIDASSAIGRAHLGIKTMIREGSPPPERNLSSIIPSIVQEGLDTRNFVLVSDDRHPSHLMEEGHMDFMIRKAIELGLDPRRAIQMATINCAEHFGVSDRVGAVAPGRIADLVFVEDLEAFQTSRVIVEGKVVAEKGVPLYAPVDFRFPNWALTTVNLPRSVRPEDFLIRTEQRRRARVIVIALTSAGISNPQEDLPVNNGAICPEVSKDIIKMAIIRRHHKLAEPSIVKGFVNGLGLQAGAIGSSVSVNSHNIIVAGVDDRDLAAAVNHVWKMQGGFVVVNKTRIIGEVRLPIAGLMTDQSAQDFLIAFKSIHELARTELECKLDEPFMNLIFQSISTRPWVKLTDVGLFDGKQLVPLEVRELESISDRRGS